MFVTLDVWYCIHSCSWVQEWEMNIIHICPTDELIAVTLWRWVLLIIIHIDYTIIGLQLKLKAKFFLANYIGLLCSSHSNNSQSVEFRFKYTPVTGKNFTASCHANQTGIIHYNNSHWLIYRRRRHHMIAYWQSRTTLMTMIVIMNVLAASSLMGKLKKLHQII